MKLFEMEGFLRGKCLPGDMNVNETNAEYLVRKFAELEAKCAALAAENAGLKEYRPQPGGAAMMEALDAFEAQDDYPEGGMMDAFDILCCKRVKTPATDAFLAEVRSQGIERVIEIKQKQLDGLHDDTFAIGAVRDSLRRDLYELKVLAEVIRHEPVQLRQDAKL